MDLELSGEQRSYQQLIRKLLETEAPVESVRKLPDDPTAVESDFWQKAAELGWVSMLVPEELGGGSIGGDPLLDLVIVAEEMGRSVAPGPLIPCNLVAMTLARAGTGQQQEEVLPAIMAGEAIAAWVIAGLDGSWAPGAVVDSDGGDGNRVLTGEAHYVEAGTEAEFLLVTASGRDGVSQYLILADTPGVVVTPTPGLDYSRQFASVRFDDVSVGADALVGSAGDAGDDVDRQINVAIALQGAESMGAWERVHDMTVEYSLDRTAFGRQIGSYQAIKHRLADHKLWMEAGHGMATQLARLVESGDSDPAELASGTKVLVGDKALDAVQDAIQIHGGIGVTHEHDLHLYLRRLTLNSVMFGSPRHHRDRLCTLAGLGNRED